ncbi:unnamed protein product [Phytophthora fragariaefolia]|uniref:Unnamed protein product n=1 Tax=Phytophthora fragariaefolia TaxID=1490495 RepID=A0A9W6XFD2_9STRA|nr:unnamed protein product [Phytophthora fragariaefolia]
MPISTALQNAQKHRRELYAFAKRNGLNVRWKMKTKMMESIVAPFKQAKASKTATAFKKAKLSTEKSYLDTINQTSGKVDVSLSRFNRIRRQIVSPADKKLLIHIKGSDGRIVKSYQLNDRIRKNFFRYLTKAEYNLQAFHVYSDDFLIEDEYNENSFVPGESDDEDAANYPCFLFALYKAGALPDLVNQISQTMFNSGATVDFIRKTAMAFNICISVKQSRIDQKTGRAKNDTTVYGDKRNTMLILGSVGEHLFAIAPTNITKGALDNPELVAKHGRSDFRIKGGRVVFNDKNISFLDSYTVISYLYHHRETHLTPITKQNMPKLLNKYQEVRSLTKGDFSASNFRLMGRVPGKEVKLGQAVFRAFNSKTREYNDVRKYNVIYFDFETLVIDNVHVPYCVSYCISEFNENSPSSQSFSETRNIYRFGCERQFLEALPPNSKNLLWAYNAGFGFLLKHMSYSSRDTNMIDCGTNTKQAHGFYKKREIRSGMHLVILNCKACVLRVASERAMFIIPRATPTQLHSAFSRQTKAATVAGVVVRKIIRRYVVDSRTAFAYLTTMEPKFLDRDAASEIYANTNLLIEAREGVASDSDENMTLIQSHFNATIYDGGQPTGERLRLTPNRDVAVAVWEESMTRLYQQVESFLVDAACGRQPTASVIEGGF